MCIKKIDVLCHSLISVYEQGKEKEWVLYIDHWFFFFLHSVEFFENLLIHIRKEICLHFNEMMCKKLNWIVIIGWKPMCSMLNWFNDFLKNLHWATPYSFPYWKSDFVSISKNSILSLLKRILFLTEKLLFQKHTKF